MYKKLLSTIALSSLFLSSQAMALCSESPAKGFWTNNTTSISIDTECRSSTAGPDYTLYSVWDSEYGSAKKVLFDKVLKAHFDETVMYIHKPDANQDPEIQTLLVDVYKKDENKWVRHSLSRQKIDNGGLIPR